MARYMSVRKTPPCLTIAGSDPSGGAGIQADLKTFHQHQAYGMAVITLLTVQNTKTVEEVKVMTPELVHAQLQAVLKDIPPRAAKTGALGNSEVIDAVALGCRSLDFPLVLDPVMVSKHGLALIDPEAEETLRKLLIPRAHLITPNIPEAERISERSIRNLSEMEKAANSIAKLGVKHVLIKGGHLENEASDVLWSEGQVARFPAARIDTQNTHGTGCVFSAAITAHLSYGRGIFDAVTRAKAFITEAIETNPRLGEGYGPVNMFARSGSQ